MSDTLNASQLPHQQEKATQQTTLPQTSNLNTIKPKRAVGLGLTLILILLAFVGGGVGVYMYTQKNVILPVPVASPLENTSPSARPIIKNYQFLYIRDGNVYVYDRGTMEEQQVTNDGTNYSNYRKPQWVDEKTVAFVYCENYQDPATQYSCGIYTQTLDSAEKKELIKLTSKRNDYGTFLGADIYAFRFSTDGRKLAYLSYEYGSTSDSQEKDVKLKLLDITSNKTTLLDEYYPTAGRGGSLDDETSVYFSPSGNKLVATVTIVYPSIKENQGTMFVYDTLNGSLIWFQAKTMSTFGRFLDENTLIAKQEVGGDFKTRGTAYFVTIDLSKNTDNPASTVKQVANAQGRYGIHLANNQEFAYFVIDETQGEGLKVARFSLTDSSETDIISQYLPIARVGESHLLVVKLRPCQLAAGDAESECGMDIYNGYIPDSRFGLLELSDGSFEEFKTTIGPILEADVYP